MTVRRWFGQWAPTPETQGLPPLRVPGADPMHHPRNIPSETSPSAPTSASAAYAPRPVRLSLVVPVYNEERTLPGVLAALAALDVGVELEVLVVNDGSTDATASILDAVSDRRFTVVHLPRNRGKGHAVLEGIARAAGTHLLVFDADDEYSTDDLPALVAPLRTGRAEVVYGVRLGGMNSTQPSLLHAVGNRIMTWSVNVLYGCAIHDLHTCLKLLPLPLLRDLRLTERGFGLDTEITCEMLRKGFRPFEVPVSYVGRTKEEGKKIAFRDALRCFQVMVAVRRRGRTRPGCRDRSLVWGAPVDVTVTGTTVTGGTASGGTAA